MASPYKVYGPTARQQELLDHIARLYAETGKPPTHARLAALMGVCGQEIRRQRLMMVRKQNRGWMQPDIPGLRLKSWE